MHFIKQQSNNIDCFDNGWNLWLFSIVILRCSHQNTSSLVQEHFTDLQSSTKKQTPRKKHTEKKHDVFVSKQGAWSIIAGSGESGRIGDGMADRPGDGMAGEGEGTDGRAVRGEADRL